MPNKHALIKLMLTTWKPDDKDSDGYTALHLACKYNSTTYTVNLLLSVAHCDPNSKSNNRNVPLQMTTNSEVIKDLIRHGANTRNRWEQANLFSYQLKYSSLEILLLERALSLQLSNRESWHYCLVIFFR